MSISIKKEEKRSVSSLHGCYSHLTYKKPKDEEVKLIAWG